MSTSSKNSIADLEEMELHDMETLMRSGGLSILSAANIITRADLVRKLKATNYRRFSQQLDENGGQAFASTNQTGKKCNFPVPVHKLTASVPVEGKEPKNLGPQHYLNVSQQAEWSRNNLTSTKYIPTSGETITLASEMCKYPVKDYHKYVSQKVLDDTTFKQAFMAEYETANPGLTTEMIDTHIFIMQCGITAEDPNKYADHCDFVHGIYADDLTQEQILKVDTKIIFKLDAAKDIENV